MQGRKQKNAVTDLVTQEVGVLGIHGGVSLTPWDLDL